MASLLDLVRDERIRDNLPSPVGDFLGRNLELERVAGLLDSEGAVQLVGPPGVGKSRLAVEHARGFLSTVATRRTAWFCDLTSAEGAMGALAAVGRPLGLTFETADEDAAVARIGAVLDELGAVLVLIDNAEVHADEVGEWVASWRTSAPGARFIVTTRKTVDELPTIDLRPLKSADATGLLEDRIRRVRPDFRPDASTREDLERLARRLDGLPLAVELIAPRLRIVSPRQILEQLDTSQGPLEAALRRSWELLEDDERHVFASLSVFRGGFDATAATAVLGENATEMLGRLMDHSLLRSRSTREFPDEPRLFYPVAIRAFAAERLAESGDRDEVVAAHVAYFVEAGEGWDDGVDTGNEVESIRRLVVEHANLLAAWEHAEGTDRIRLGLVLHMALQRGGPFHRQFDIVDDTVERAEAHGDDLYLGRALLNRSRAQRWRNDFDASIADLERALECARSSGDFRSEASALRNLAAGYWGRGELDKTRSFAEEALRRSLEEQSVVDEVTSRNGLGFLLAYTGELGEAQEHLERSLQLARSQADEPGLIALASSAMAALMSQRGAFDRAELYASEALENYRIVDHVREIPMELLACAEARAALGNADAARADVRESLEIARRMGFRLVELRARHVASFVELIAGDPAAALDQALRALAAFGESSEKNLVLGARLHVVIARSLQGDVEPAEKTWTEVTEMLDGRAGGRWAALAEVAEGFLALARSRGGGDGLDRAREVADRAFDDDAIANLLAELLANELPADQTPTYRISPDGRRFQVPGDSPVDITRRKALRGILELLVQLRQDSPGTPTEREELLEAGWPGEKMTPDSASQRIYVTVKRLRDLGLEDLLVTAGDGYMLDPSIDVTVAALD